MFLIIGEMRLINKSQDNLMADRIQFPSSHEEIKCYE